MKTFFPLISLMLFFVLSESCKDDDGNGMDNGNNIYSACCETPAVEVEIGTGHIYIPNIFTPNGDGINDLFIIHGDQDIAEIERITINDAENNVVFEFYNFLPNDFSYSWEPSLSETPNGIYNFETTIRNVDGDVEMLTNSLCLYRCKTAKDSIPSGNLSKCNFSTQHNGEGGLDTFSPSLEDADCF